MDVILHRCAAFAMNSYNWVFTLNNPESDTLPPYDRIKYCIWQVEQGEQGTEHIQGYVEFRTKHRLSAVKKWLYRAHWEVRRGTAQQAREYSSKEETRVRGPWSIGEQEVSRQGHRTDLSRAVEILTQQGMRAVAQQEPEAFVKFHRGLQALEGASRQLPSDAGFEPRPWQSRVLQLLSESPDDRHIIWVTDSRGNSGKSRLARHLLLMHGAQLLLGRSQDMAYMFREETRIVVFDVTRQQQEFVDHLYSMAEMLKNGVLVSTKYESRAKIFDPPHVVFFSNQTWDTTKWSRDRVVELDLNNPGMHTPLASPVRVSAPIPTPTSSDGAGPSSSTGRLRRAALVLSPTRVRMELMGSPRQLDVPVPDERFW